MGGAKADLTYQHLKSRKDRFMTNHPSLRYLILVLVLVAAFAVLAWISIFSNVGDGPKTPRIEVLVELSKVLAQLVLVTLIGATVTYFYSQHAKETENRKLRLEEDNKLRRELLSSLIDVRAGVEKTRREFRLLLPSERGAGYDRTIQNLLQARLDLSKVWHGTETWAELYLDDGKTIQAGLLGMKEFLDKIISEYEAGMEHAALVQEESTSWFGRKPRPLQDPAKSPLFAAFVTAEGGDSYTEEFLKQNYRRAAQMIRKHLLSAD
ncbi:MAG TPA: hypothetical protein VGW76_08260 [Pyrinomonadaceae bacterium]|nr:hypothetical protein [Pyrinomonadaceae bacterium]